MFKMMKKLLLGGVVSAAVFAGSAAAEVKTPQGGQQISQEQLMQLLQQQQQPSVTIDDALKVLPENLASYSGVIFTKKDLEKMLKEQFKDGKLPPGTTVQAFKQYAPELVKEIIGSKLLENSMTKAGIVPSAKMVREVIETQLKSASKQEMEFLAQMLAKDNMTLDQFIQKQSENPAFQRQAAMQLFLDKYVFKGVTVSEGAAKEYYQKNLKEFTEPGDPADSVRASHILVKVDPNASEAEKKDALAKINKILAEVKQNPKNFAALAKANSDCGSASSGGSLGAFSKGQMVPEFEKAAFALKDNEVSGVVKTQFGYHIILREPARKERVAPFDEVKSVLLNFMTRSAQQQALIAYIDKLLKEANFKSLIAAPAAK